MVYSSYTRVADFELWPSSTFRVGAPMRDAELALEQGELVAAVLAKWQSQIDGLANELDPLRTTQKL
jgi:hypothetical protein